MKGRASVWIRLIAGLSTCAVLSCCSGCAMLGYHSVSLDAEILNEGNCLLTVEGNASLPTGIPLQVTISDGDVVLKRADSEVNNGQYSAVLDISELDGNVRYDLDVSTDPTLWNEQQRDVLGEYGQYMIGSGVEDVGVNYRLSHHLLLMLPMNKREAAIRRVQNGDYAFAISSLEDVIALNKKDEEAQVWLALALVHNNQNERHLNSRAFDIMHEVKLDKISKSLRKQCQVWLDRWKQEARELQAKKERQQAIARNRAQAKKRLTEIYPGKSMADIAIGAESKSVFSVCPLEGVLDWKADIVRFDVPQREVVVYFDPQTRRVVEVATVSEKLHHSSGLGVGSELQEVLAVFPGGELTWEEESEQRATDELDGVTEVRHGQYVHPKGIVFGLKREVLGLGLSVETVTSVSVIAL